MSHDECVLVVDPDRATQKTIRGVAEMMNLECLAFSSGRDFLESEEIARPGCAILEARIPDINGLQILDTLNRRGIPLACLFLTSYATVSIAVRAMRNGAVNLLEKPVRDYELWDNIKEAIAINGERRKALAERQDCQRRVSSLTDKEQAVLRLISQGRSPRAIAKDLQVCVRTVELRRRDLMKKLGARSWLELVRFAMHAANGHSHPGFPPFAHQPPAVEAEPVGLH